MTRLPSLSTLRASPFVAALALGMLACGSPVESEPQELTDDVDDALQGVYHVFKSADRPASTSSSDSAGVELGMRFFSEQDGLVSGVRFYKGAGNSGTHVGSLWSQNGALLARVTFASESSKGWQNATFSKPVPIKANTPYVVSYFAPKGHYASTLRTFANAAKDNPPLHAYQDGSNGHNGIFTYGSASAFPTDSYRASNYWVDVNFKPATQCTPTCSGKACGDDGCGGSCGSCASGSCDASGQCGSSCTPTCSGKACGDDGCGGSCGSCASGSCDASGQCVGTTTITHGNQINASNTGVPAGVTLTPASGTVTLSTPGAVWEGRDLTGSLEITADNVTVRNCRIRLNSGYFAIQNSGKNLLVENCEIFSPSGAYTGIAGSNMTVRSCDIHNFENGIGAGSNVIVEESYIHDLYYGPGAHVDGIEWQSSGSNSVIRRNRIVLGDDTGCVNITPYNGGSANDNTVQDNLFSGGTYSLYIRGDGGGSVNGVTVTGNVWVKGSYVHGTQSIVDASGIVWSNNRLDDGTILNR
jgi:hypothetical protein